MSMSEVEFIYMSERESLHQRVRGVRGLEKSVGVMAVIVPVISGYLYTR